MLLYQAKIDIDIFREIDIDAMDTLDLTCLGNSSGYDSDSRDSCCKPELLAPMCDFDVEAAMSVHEQDLIPGSEQVVEQLNFQNAGTNLDVCGHQACMTDHSMNVIKAELRRDDQLNAVAPNVCTAIQFDAQLHNISSTVPNVNYICNACKNEAQNYNEILNHFNDIEKERFVGRFASGCKIEPQSTNIRFIKKEPGTFDQHQSSNHQIKTELLRPINEQISDVASSSCKQEKGRRAGNSYSNNLDCKAEPVVRKRSIDAFDEKNKDSGGNVSNAGQRKQIKRRRSSVRTNSWTELEELLLFGIVTEKFLANGTLYLTVPSTKHVKVTADHKGSQVKESSKKEVLVFNSYEACWKQIKEVVDRVWDKYLNSSDTNKNKANTRKPKRNWQAIARHYKVMKASVLSENRYWFFEIYETWRDKYNQNFQLLNPKEFSDFSHSSNVDSASINYVPENRFVFKSTEGISAAYSMEENIHASNRNSWNHDEETILVGVIMNRFLSFGSLTSPQKKGSDNGQAKTRKEDCWNVVKYQFDLACKRARSLFPSRRYNPRTAQALSRHFRVMKERMENQPGSHRCLNLPGLYKEWLELNCDGRLLTLKEALVTKT